MAKQLLMGNQALGLGAIAAGVNLVAGYPGTPSTEVLETVAKNNPQGAIHVEWSTNEKAAVEVAAGASYCGARTLVTMKQVGLNVASDPLMCLRYVGVKGGMVLVVADDPGPISSQTEQDTRRFGSFSKVPVLDPGSPEEAYEMIQWAFELSEQCKTPVIVRPTTRVCHGSAPVEVSDAPYEPHPFEGFERDSDWIIFPKRSLKAHNFINKQLPELAAHFSQSSFNLVEDWCAGSADGADGGAGAVVTSAIASSSEPGAVPRLGIATGGVSYAYLQEALRLLTEAGAQLPALRLFKVATPYPFPQDLALEFCQGLEDVLVFEELDHVIEDELLRLVGAQHLDVTIHGKLTGQAKAAGENSVETLCQDLCAYLGLPQNLVYDPKDSLGADAPEAPGRPPVLCAGCPHRASFYAVKQAMKGRKAFWAGDIGCYTLGNAAPLNMVDTCLCMGANITIAQGMHVAEPDGRHFAFIGDSTFFASGMTGIASAVYNGNDITVIVLDNSITAMTGGQPHPGTGIRLTNPTEQDGERALSIPAVLEALGCASVQVVNPFDLEAAVEAVTKVVDNPGVQAIVYKAPCIQLHKPAPSLVIDQETCRKCRACITKIGCPAIVDLDGQIQIDSKQCNGCGLCAQICTFGSITCPEGGQQ